MNNMGLFFQFGIRMQGGPAFLKRTRTSFGQLQTRTRTQTGTVICNCGFVCKLPTTAWACYNGIVNNGTVCNSNNVNALNWVCVPGNYSYKCNGCHCSNCWTGEYLCSPTICQCGTCPVYSAWSAWSDTSSCTPSTTRECQTIYSFREQDWLAYEEVDVCTPQSPTAALNALQIECVPQ